MTTKKEIKKPILYKIIIIVLFIIILGILGVGINASFINKQSSNSQENNELNIVIYKDASVDMNGDGILDYVISAEVIIVGENQNLPQSQSPQE